MDALFYQAQNREQTFLDLNVADINSGASTTLFKETSPAWVKSSKTPRYLKDNSFVWQSARSGWRHLYISTKMEMAGTK
jgi:dipeptidyl-peptidase-4